MKVIGMMSGTSFDAVDAVAAELTIRGDTLHLTPLGVLSEPYPDAVHEALTASLPPAAVTMASVCRLDTVIGQVFADLAVRAEHDLCNGDADLVVSHGQTVYHWTEGDAALGTLQLGEPAWIAERTGRTVVSDLRSRDVAAGGQGAPLVSALDALWLRDLDHVAAALNLGGIANITVVDPALPPIAFDTGPANALIDAAMEQYTDGRLHFDSDGAMASDGRVVPQLLDALLDEPYYRRPAPKSTGKELFNRSYLDTFTARFPSSSAADVVATLTALTAETVAAAVRESGARELIAAGGGTRNRTMMRMLGDRLPSVTVRTSDELGLPAEAKEAYAFAVLGFLTVSGLPATVPSCTGARHASILGSVTPGRNGMVQVDRSAAAPTRLRVHAEPDGTNRPGTPTDGS